ncbi:MAG TPA: thiamine pyrophosphate-dependent dehydrogenase E1 component subunit alpha [Bacteroidia bacterium]|nr:thiamine pyrophosphate-dependent dehydrogenase E1 component subunit alpha [Bacteroidia bacterium]
MKYSSQLLMKLYRSMLRIRLTEESLVEPIQNRTINCPVHLYSGQEAVAAGICANLSKKDYIFGNHRSHGHYLAKGGDLKEMIAEIYCKETGCTKGRGGSMHLISPENGVMGIVPIVAGTISLATGAAMASRTRNDKRVSVSFFGDGATGEGVLYEALNFAAIYKLPIIFVCENNLYSTHMPIEDIRTDNHIAEIGPAFGLKTFRCEGNNVLKVYEVAKKSVEHCRGGKGPAFIEFLTYRLRGHVGPDDNIQGSHTDIRPLSEISKWKRKDPVLNFESYLLKKKILSEKKAAAIKDELNREIKDAHDFALKSSRPPADELLNYVFAR